MSGQSLVSGRVQAQAATAEAYQPISIDPATGGVLVTAIGGGGGGGLVFGNHTPSDNYANPTDAINSIGLNSAWDGANWDRMRIAPLGDGITSPTCLTTGAFEMVWNEADGVWLRAQAIDWTDGALPPTVAIPASNAYLSGLALDGATTNAGRIIALNDTQALSVPALLTEAVQFGFNGATYDRIRAVTPADDMAAVISQATASFNLAYDANGTNWDRVQLVTPADNLTAPGSVATNAFLSAFDTIGGNWDRVLMVTPGDNVTPTNTLAVGSFPHAYDGTNWDRVQSRTPADAQGVAQGLVTTSQLQLWNNPNGNYDRARINPSTLNPSPAGMLVAFDSVNSPNTLFGNYGSSFAVAIAAGNHVLFGVDVSIESLTTITTIWFMLFNKASTPVNGDTPVYRRYIPNYIVLAGGFSVGQETFGSGLGVLFTLGLAYAWSTTPNTLTVPTGGQSIASAVNLIYR